VPSGSVAAGAARRAHVSPMPNRAFDNDSRFR
jgi:hypothetical protein